MTSVAKFHLKNKQPGLKKHAQNKQPLVLSGGAYAHHAVCIWHPFERACSNHELEPGVKTPLD